MGVLARKKPLLSRRHTLLTRRVSRRGGIGCLFARLYWLPHASVDFHGDVSIHPGRITLNKRFSAAVRHWPDEVAKGAPHFWRQRDRGDRCEDGPSAQ